MIKKIVCIGPESTGKSYLTQALAKHFGTIKVEEYAREFLLKKKAPYDVQDLSLIADGQLQLEVDGEAKLENSNLLFIDTDLYVIKVWSEFVFGVCDNAILKQIAKRKYDLYLLCNPDLPWVKDELREYPDQATRDILYQHYKEILTSQKTPWVDIKGDYDERVKTAIHAVNQIL
jgi:NadR type nicotinamide-nucleotide adenylyltransferase